MIPSIIIIIGTIFNDDFPTHETDGKCSIRIQEMTENRLLEVKMIMHIIYFTSQQDVKINKAYYGYAVTILQ